MFAQVHSRALSSLLSFESYTPFDNWEYWSEIRQLSLAEQAARLRDPAIKAKLVEIARREYTGPRVVGAEARPPHWDHVYPMSDMAFDIPSMGELARQQGVNPVELMIDMEIELD